MRRPRQADPRLRASWSPSVVALGLLGLLAPACAGDYVARTRAMRQAYERTDYETALRLLDEQLPGHPNDRLLYLLDKGMLLHAAERWRESTAVFAEAEKVAAELDIISVTEEAAVLLANERERAYRGEDFERLLINVFKALNYAAQGELEDALVEVRRLNERLQKMILEEKKPYEQLAIARYLGGIFYEDQHDADSAFIDYSKAEEVAGDLGPLLEPLVRLARETGRDEVYAALRQRYPQVSERPLGASEGELVLLVEYGLSPEKVSSEPPHGVNLIAVPRYRTRHFPRQPAVASSGALQATAHLVSSVEQVAEMHLSERLLRLAAKSAASTALKAGVAAGVAKATDSGDLGWLTFLILSWTTQPDLRSWLSLPAQFDVARLRLPAGRQEITLTAGIETSRHVVEIVPGRIRLLVVRRYF
jgi:uncharacterized protein